MDLTETEIRVLGCLLEKQRTTPDVYPLSLNALRLACNQSTNRDPVVDYDEDVVGDALRRAERRGWVRLASGAGSRAAKFRHRLDERLPMDDGEQATLCLLMLRGAQTPGELKTRSERLHPFADLPSVSATLGRLCERGLVTALPRQPGQKEERYAHLLAGALDAAPGPSARTAGAPLQAKGDRSDTQSARAQGGDSDRVVGDAADPTALAAPAYADALSDVLARLARLEREVAELRAALGD